MGHGVITFKLGLDSLNGYNEWRERTKKGTEKKMSIKMRYSFSLHFKGRCAKRSDFLLHCLFIPLKIL